MGLLVLLKRLQVGPHSTSFQSVNRILSALFEMEIPIYPYREIIELAGQTCHAYTRQEALIGLKTILKCMQFSKVQHTAFHSTRKCSSNVERAKMIAQEFEILRVFFVQVWYQALCSRVHQASTSEILTMLELLSTASMSLSGSNTKHRTDGNHSAIIEDGLIRIRKVLAHRIHKNRDGCSYSGERTLDPDSRPQKKREVLDSDIHLIIIALSRHASWIKIYEEEWSELLSTLSDQLQLSCLTPLQSLLTGYALIRLGVSAQNKLIILVECVLSAPDDVVWVSLVHICMFLHTLHTVYPEGIGIDITLRILNRAQQVVGINLACDKSSRVAPRKLMPRYIIEQLAFMLYACCRPNLNVSEECPSRAQELAAVIMPFIRHIYHDLSEERHYMTQKVCCRLLPSMQYLLVVPDIPECDRSLIGAFCLDVLRGASCDVQRMTSEDIRSLLTCAARYASTRETVGEWGWDKELYHQFKQTSHHFCSRWLSVANFADVIIVLHNLHRLGIVQHSLQDVLPFLDHLRRGLTELTTSFHLLCILARVVGDLIDVHDIFENASYQELCRSLVDTLSKDVPSHVSELTALSIHAVLLFLANTTVRRDCLLEKILPHVSRFVSSMDGKKLVDVIICLSKMKSLSQEVLIIALKHLSRGLRQGFNLSPKLLIALLHTVSKTSRIHELRLKLMLKDIDLDTLIHALLKAALERILCKQHKINLKSLSILSISVATMHSVCTIPLNPSDLSSLSLLIHSACPVRSHGEGTQANGLHHSSKEARAMLSLFVSTTKWSFQMKCDSERHNLIKHLMRSLPAYFEHVGHSQDAVTEVISVTTALLRILPSESEEKTNLEEMEALCVPIASALAVATDHVVSRVKLRECSILLHFFQRMISFECRHQQSVNAVYQKVAHSIGVRVQELLIRTHSGPSVPLISLMSSMTKLMYANCASALIQKLVVDILNRLGNWEDIQSIQHMDVTVVTHLWCTLVQLSACHCDLNLESESSKRLFNCLTKYLEVNQVELKPESKRQLLQCSQYHGVEICIL